MFYTDNPLADFDRHDAQQAEWVNGLPVCSECGEPIQTEKCFEFKGVYICPKCMEDNHEVWTVDCV